ncbi:MAG: DUF3035 domain-containing protein [Yoonia sp.]|nr:DUF3035 domain-containing protein [Yoonia sp.]
MRKAILAILTLAALAACSSGKRPLHDMRSASGGPDEFTVMPVGPLEIPEVFTLPVPTPGATNRVDPTPKADAIAALGGRPSAVVAGGVPVADNALVAAASRNGVQSDVRAVLAAEDAAFRKGKNRYSLRSALSRDRYFKAYARFALDAYAELQRFRNLGVATPSAPPR